MERKSILLVDDEPVILKSFSKELVNDFDFDVTIAASGEEGITLIEDRDFDLVVTDLIMPGLDGFQVLKAAKHKNLQTMVIILTGYGDFKAAVDSLRLSANDFLAKPCDIDELMIRISNCFIKQDLLRKVNMYEKLLPVCSYCKKIRADQPGEHGKGNWYSLEEYLYKVKGVYASHGICPDCFAKQLKYINNKK